MLSIQWLGGRCEYYFMLPPDQNINIVCLQMKRTINYWEDFMNRYLAASILPLALVSNLSYAAVKAEAHAHRKATAHHAAAVTKVNINTANATQLATLKGIGDKRAQAIVAYRKAHGPFADVNGLSAVKGIGEKKVIAIQKQGLAYISDYSKS